MPTRELQEIDRLKSHFLTPGEIVWIGARPQRGAQMVESPEALLESGHGMLGDRAGQRPNSKRQITLFQAEYLPLIAQWTNLPALHFRDLRRNIAVRGINLNALNGQTVRLGAAVIEVSGFCHPCRKLEQQLGYGVFNVLRGHGGLTARVLSEGIIRVGDSVTPIVREECDVMTGV